MDAKLTVVIPVYNRAGIVGSTLESVLSQTLRPLRVVLVDNNSTDGTADMLRAWQYSMSAPDFEVELISESTPGAAAARNAGLERVTTPWVMFFDSDDTMRPGHCARAMAAAGDDADIVGWDVDLTLPSGHRRGRFAGHNAQFDNIFHGGMATQRWCARTDLVRGVGGWNPSARIWNDIELGARLIASGARLRHIDGAPTVDVLFTPDSITNTPPVRYLDQIDSTLDYIAATLPEEQRHYADFKRVLAAGEAMRCHGAPEVRRAAMRLYDKSLAAAGSAARRLLMRLSFNYIRFFSRGTVPLLSLFLK